MRQAEAVRTVAVMTHGHPEALGEALARLEEVTRKAGVELLFSEEEAAKHGRDADPDDFEKADLAVVLGGDGTMLRALQRSLGKGKLQAALADATAALEMAPEDTNIQLTLADVHMAMGKHELAAEEYQRVLDVKPADKRAKLGLQKAAAPPKTKPGAKKKKGGR